MPFVLSSLYITMVLSRVHELMSSLLPSNIMDIVIIAATIALVVETQRNRMEMPRNLPQYWLIVGLFGAALLSDVVLTNFASLIHTVGFMGKIMIAFFVVSLTCDSPRKIRTLYLIYVLIGLLICLHCVMQTYIGYGLRMTAPLYMPGGGQTYLRTRYLGILGDPNDTALYFNLCIPLVFPLINSRRWFSRLISWIAILLMIWGIYMTQSRGGYVAMGAMMLVLLHQILYRKQFYFMFLIVVVLLIMAVPVRLARTSLGGQERTHLWGQANQQFKQHPLTGVGVYRIQDYLDGGKVPHNSFVHAYSEMGIIGYFFWLSLLTFSVVSCFRISQMVPDNDDDRLLILEAQTMVASLVGFAAASFFLSRTYFLPLYILLATATAIYNQAAKRVGLQKLNIWCGINRRTIWHYPVLTVASIFMIYLFMLTINRLS